MTSISSNCKPSPELHHSPCLCLYLLVFPLHYPKAQSPEPLHVSTYSTIRPSFMIVFNLRFAILLDNAILLFSIWSPSLR